jgi:predicted DNA-binding transcriptional regulator AlpA
MEPLLMTIEDLAALLQLPESWIYTRTGPKCPPAERIPHLKLGRHLRFDREEVTAWLAKHHRNGQEPSG